MKVEILEPTMKPTTKHITENDFRKYLSNPNTPTSNCFNHGYGGFDDIKFESKSKCPIFKDKIDYKSFTVIVDKDLQRSAEYWCEYFHGGGSVSRTMNLDNNKVAIRSDYQCW